MKLTLNGTIANYTNLFRYDYDEDLAYTYLDYAIDSEGEYMASILPTFETEVDWIDYHPDGGINHKEERGSIIISANDDIDGRVGVATFRWDDYTYKITIVQDGFGETELSFSYSKLNFSSEGEFVNYLVQNSEEQLYFYTAGDTIGFVSSYDTKKINDGLWQFMFASLEWDGGGELPSGTKRTGKLVISNGVKSVEVALEMVLNGGFIYYEKNYDIKSYINVPSKSNDNSLTIATKNIQSIQTVVDNSGILVNTSIVLLNRIGNVDYYALSFDVRDNGTRNNRYGNVIVKGLDNYGNWIEFILTVIQNGVIAFPVWEDTEFVYPFSSEDYIDYSLYDNDNENTFFEGRAYRILNNQAISFNINKIVQSYITSSINFDTLDMWQKDNSATMNFSIVINGEVYQDYFAYYDYTFDDFKAVGNNKIAYVNNNIKSMSINGYNVISILVKENGERFMVKDPNGNVMINRTFNDMGVWHYVVRPNYFPMAGKYKVLIGDVEVSYLDMIDNCGRPNNYQLIYKNLNGGYDSLFLEGNDLKKDTMTNYHINKSFSNKRRDYEIKHYLKDITRKYELHTGWFTDAQAEKMQNLFESTQIYLNNINENKIIPVIITNTEFVFKTYSNQNHTMVNYDLSVSESQTRGIR